MGVVRRINIFFCRWPKELRGDVMDGHKQCQVGLWPPFYSPVKSDER